MVPGFDIKGYEMKNNGASNTRYSNCDSKGLCNIHEFEFDLLYIS